MAQHIRTYTKLHNFLLLIWHKERKTWYQFKILIDMSFIQVNFFFLKMLYKERIVKQN